METIIFKKSGPPITVSFVVKNGVLAVAYRIRLSDKDSNQAIEIYEGDNQNTADDSYELPAPAESNDERIIRFTTEFVGLDPELSKEYSFGIEFYQGDEFLRFIEEKGTLSSNTQSTLRFVQLKTEE